MELQLSVGDDGVTVARLVGRLDAASTGQIELKFAAGVVAAARPAIVDLSELSFIGSIGIGMLIGNARALARKNTKMVLFGATDLVRTALEHIALDQIIPIVATESEARQRLAD